MSSTGNVTISPVMAKAVNNVLSTQVPTEFTFTINLTSESDTTYKYTPSFFIESASITQNFADDYTDDIRVSFTASPQEYMAIFNHAQDLLATTIRIYVNQQSGQRIYTIPPIVKSYKALLLNQENLYSKHPTGALQPTPNMPIVEQHVATRIPVHLQLIEKEAYTLRQQQFHGIFSNSTVASAIAAIVDKFEIKQLNFISPDNTHSWGNIVIPPAQNINDIFDYIQFTYGVYMKGIEFYYTNNTLYIYPPYELSPKMPSVVNFYNSPNGSYAGAFSYHSVTGNTIDIVTTDKVETKDLSIMASENVGGSFSFLRASKLVDGFVGVSDNGVYVSKDASLTVGTPYSRTMVNNANVDRYQAATDNIFIQSSKLVKWQASLVSTKWLHAVPDLLIPGHKSTWNIDDNGVFKKRNGILEAVHYDIKFIRKSMAGPVYSCDAEFRLRVDSDTVNNASSG